MLHGKTKQFLMKVASVSKTGLRKRAVFILLFPVIFCLGFALGAAKGPSSWSVLVNGKPVNLHLYLIKNSFFVTLNDLAELPGWKILMDLGARKISLTTPSALAPAAQKAGLVKKSTEENVLAPVKSKSKASPKVSTQNPHNLSESSKAIELKGGNQGPPNNVRMTVGAALSALDELRQSLENDLPVETVKEKREKTIGIVEQAQNLLSSLPRTNTLQADIQMVSDDLQSAINLTVAASQVKQKILPWTHPASQALFLKYPDLRSCHISEGSTEGLDIACSRKVLFDITREDFDDVRRSLDEYREK